MTHLVELGLELPHAASRWFRLLRAAVACCKQKAEQRTRRSVRPQGDSDVVAATCLVHMGVMFSSASRGGYIWYTWVSEDCLGKSVGTFGLLPMLCTIVRCCERLAESRPVLHVRAKQAATWWPGGSLAYKSVAKQSTIFHKLVIRVSRDGNRDALKTIHENGKTGQ